MSASRVSNLPDYKDVLNTLDYISATSDPAELSKVYGSRFNRAWQLLKGRAVKKCVFKSGMVRWIVEGKQHYLIYPDVGFCSCDDFYFAVMNGKALACQHLIAQRLAEKLNDYVIEKKEGSVVPSEAAEKREVVLGETPQVVKYWEGTGH